MGCGLEPLTTVPHMFSYQVQVLTETVERVTGIEPA